MVVRLGGLGGGGIGSLKGTVGRGGGSFGWRFQTKLLLRHYYVNHLSFLMSFLTPTGRTDNPLHVSMKANCLIRDNGTHSAHG